MDLVAAFRKKLREWTKTSAVDGRPFVLTHSVIHWLRTPITDNALYIHSICSTVSPTAVHLSSHIDVDRNPMILCILFEMNRVDVMEDMLTHEVTDDTLPVSMEFLHDLFRHKIDKVSQDGMASQFYDLQWRYCPARFKLLGRHRFTSETVLPISRRVHIATGSTACVWQIAIPEEFLDRDIAQSLAGAMFNDAENGIESSVQLVMKTFDRTTYQQFALTEICAYRRLRNISKAFDQFLCDFEYGSDLNILMECGEYDLYGYFALQSPPVTRKDITQYWRSMFNVCSALRVIHNMPSEMLDAGRKDYRPGYKGWHGDFKPDNIMKFGNTWRVIDLGFTSAGESSEEHLARFPRRLAGTYAPPERALSSIPSTQSMQTADIWSLGCILSIAATWVILGKQGISQYTAVRLRASEGAAATAKASLPNHESQSKTLFCTDCFHDGRRVLSEVQQWHKFLKTNSRKSDNITGRILDLIDSCMFVYQDYRMNAEEIYAKWIDLLLVCEMEGADDVHWNKILADLDFKEFEIPMPKQLSWISHQH